MPSAHGLAAAGGGTGVWDRYTPTSRRVASSTSAMAVQDRHHIKLRVYERGAGETLACGTGACAAVVAGIGWGLLDQRVDVHTRGGLLTIEWAGGAQDRVRMTGPAEFVFEGQIDIPDAP